MLIGAGYNAYVIYGKAPRFITSKDETRLPPPEMIDDIKIIEPNLEEKEDDTQPTIKDKEPIFSQYDSEEKAEKEEMERQEMIKNPVINDDMPELERNDPFKSRRVHAWVMIRKCAQLESEEEVFIEPSTGRLYTIKDCPYEKVDALFNNVNFYINLHFEKELNEIDWNFNKATNWEFVMLNAKEQSDESPEDENPEENKEEEEGVIEHVPTNQVRVNLHQNEEEKFSEMLDMPPPWPNKISISLQKYNERSPTTTQVFFYQKTKVERFAPGSQADGLTVKIYNYHDFARFILKSIEHRYRNRGDKLYKRMEYPYQHKSIDYYLPGQIWHWR